ncbi:MAG: hypothetical protein MJE77_12600 [Proteobacteria bacterium]|nr:hypothetical protein [Pseudomonadota bacterium]
MRESRSLDPGFILLCIDESHAFPCRSEYRIRRFGAGDYGMSDDEVAALLRDAIEKHEEEARQEAR